MFTSGTTGKSKGVMLTHRNQAENAGSINMDLPERMVLLSVLPIHHAYCLCLDVLKGHLSGLHYLHQRFSAAGDEEHPALQA